MTFSNSISFLVIQEYGKGAAAEILTVFEHVYDIACVGVPGISTF